MTRITSLWKIVPPSSWTLQSELLTEGRKRRKRCKNRKMSHQIYSQLDNYQWVTGLAHIAISVYFLLSGFAIVPLLDWEKHNLLSKPRGHTYWYIHLCRRIIVVLD